MMALSIMPEGSVITAKCKTKVTADAEESATHTLRLNFTGASIDDVLEDARRSAVIRWQRQYREHPDRFPEGIVEVDMASVYAQERVQMTAKEKAASILARLSPEELAEVLASVQK